MHGAGHTCIRMSRNVWRHDGVRVPWMVGYAAGRLPHSGGASTGGGGDTTWILKKRDAKEHK